MSKKKGSAHTAGISHDDAANMRSEAEREQEALRRKSEGLIGDTGQNRNLTGSSTWETLPDQPRESKRSSGNR